MPKSLHIRRRRMPWLVLASGVISFFLFAPVAVIVLFSFSESRALALPIERVSLRWYEAIFNSPQFLASLRNTVVVGATTALLAGLLGTLAAYALTRYRFRLRPLVMGIFAFPIALPPLFLGIALLVYFTALTVPLSLGTVVIGHLVYTMPYMILVLVARLYRYDWTQEEAARDLGASATRAFWRVTLPQIAPSLLGAAILVFALSFDEILITFFVIGHESTLPMLIWSSMRRSLDPSVNAMAVVVLVASVVIVLITTRLLRTKEFRL